MSDTPRTAAVLESLMERVNPLSAHAAYSTAVETLGRQAIDLERELDETRRALSETPKWARVSSPPPTSAVVGFWEPIGEAVDARCFAVTIFTNGEWRSVDDPDDVYGWPSHWMPLPEAPK